MPFLLPLVAVVSGGSGFALSSWSSGLLNKLFLFGLISAGLYYVLVGAA